MEILYYSTSYELIMEKKKEKGMVLVIYNYFKLT